MTFPNNHSRHKKNFADLQYPEDRLRVGEFDETLGGVCLQIIRKIDNGGKKKETEVIPFVLPAKDIDLLHAAMVKAQECR